MVIKNEIKKNISSFDQLCRKYNIKYLYAFGSSVADTFNDESDIDLLVEVDVSDPIERGEQLISLWDGFEHFFTRKVDLLTETSIQNPYLRRSIDASKVLIYDGTRQEIFV